MSYLVLNRLSKRYGDLTAVEDLSLSVERGEFISLLGVVAHAPQQAVGDTRRAAGAARHFGGAVRRDAGIEQAGAAGDDAAEVVGVVELQPRNDAEAVAQRIGQHAGAGGGADQGERLQVGCSRRPGARRSPAAGRR